MWIVLYIFIKGIEFIVENFLGPDGFICEFYLLFKELNTSSTHFFPENKRGRNTFQFILLSWHYSDIKRKFTNQHHLPLWKYKLKWHWDATIYLFTIAKIRRKKTPTHNNTNCWWGCGATGILICCW